MRLHSGFQVHRHPGNQPTRGTRLQRSGGGEGLPNRRIQTEDETGEGVVSQYENLSDICKRISLRDIVIATARVTEVPARLILSDRRRAEDVIARQIVYTLAAELTTYSYPQIGKSLGRDHTSVIQGIRSFERKTVKRPFLVALLETVRQAVLEGGQVEKD